MQTFATLLEEAMKRQGDDRFSRSVDAFEAMLAASAGVDPVTPPCLRVFELDLRASLDELKAAFRRQVRATHPDLAGGSAEAFMRVSDAYSEAARLLAR